MIRAQVQHPAKPDAKILAALKATAKELGATPKDTAVEAGTSAGAYSLTIHVIPEPKAVK